MNKVGLCVLGILVGGCWQGWVAQAAVRYVDVACATPLSPYTNAAHASTNIQLAIDAAASGDQILVAPGVYNLNGAAVYIPPEKPGLHLQSIQRRAAIIDGRGLSRCVELHGTNCTLEGFTIRNGYYDSYGGGVILYRPAILRDCWIVSNRAYSAAGIMCHRTNTIENCTIQDNHADYMGGGVVLYDGSQTLVKNCAIFGNTASNYGGGLYLQNNGNFIVNGTVDCCRIYNNQALVEAGGVFAGGGTIQNSVIYSNYAGQSAGGVFMGSGGAGRLINCTVICNTAGEENGGVEAWSQAACWNNIIYYNNAPAMPNLSTNHGAIASNCCVYPIFGPTCFTSAPVFVNMAAQDFHLDGAQPCVDGGATNSFVPGHDFDGYPRPVDGKNFGLLRYDVGAFEYALHFRPGMSIANNTLTLYWDVFDRCGYVLEGCTNLSNPVWQRLTGTNAWLQPYPSVQTQQVAVTAPWLLYRVRDIRLTPGR